jgi:hypothetical protein
MHPDQETCSDAARGGFRPNALSQSVGRHRRRAPRLQNLTCPRRPPGSRGRSSAEPRHRCSQPARAELATAARGQVAAGRTRGRDATARDRGRRPPGAAQPTGGDRRRRAPRTRDFRLAARAAAAAEPRRAPAGRPRPAAAGARLRRRKFAATQKSPPYRELFLLARPDLEEELSRWIGDLPARRVSLCGAGAILVARTRAQLRRNVAEYLQEESRDLVGKTEVEEFLRGVDELRDDRRSGRGAAARLELRLQGGA